MSHEVAAQLLREHVDIDQYGHKCCGCGWDSALDEDPDVRWADHVARLMFGRKHGIRWVT